MSEYIYGRDIECSHDSSSHEPCPEGHHSHADSCGCGHEHGHEQEHPHEHSHMHEHDHSHEQDYIHEHGHSHEHDHLHEHDGSCGCGCGHDHNHEHIEPHHSSSTAPKKVYLLENLDCANCGAKVERRIAQLPEVEDAVVIYATKQLWVYSRTREDLLPKLQAACSAVEPDVKIVPKAAVSKNTSKKSGVSRDLLCILIGAALFIAGKVLEEQGFGTAVTIPIFTVGYLVLGGEILLTAAKNIAKGQIFDENFLMSIATLGAFAIQTYAEAVGVMLFYRIGEYFEERAVEKSRSQIMDAVDMRPETVNLIQNGSTSVIPAADAKPGDLLLIRPGDRIPLDGVITDGSSQIDTSPVTGEPVPVSAKPGDELLSGCVNISGQLTLRVEKPLEESMVSRILDSVENAAARKPKIDRFITRFSRIYTPIVVAIALCTAIIPSIVTGNWSHWVYTALSFLVISCPCALVLSVPLAFFSGIGVGSKNGILFKGGVALEQLAEVKAVVMDKTGTVTEGNFVVQDVTSAGELTPNMLLSLAAGCEQASTHPIAASIVSAANGKGLTLIKPSALEEIAGHGIKAETETGTLLCGNRKLMDKYHVELPDLGQKGFGSEVLIALNGRFQGFILISDTVKEDAPAAVSALKKLGVATAMLTGDAQSSAEAVAKETGIDEVHAKLLPQDKVAKLDAIRQKHGSVMFVGDGINDAPVLAGADVGAAMGSGADAAIEAADVVFMNSSAAAIPQAIQIARSTASIAKQNIVFALLVKILVMVFGLAGFASMWMAVFADTGVAMLCVLNSVRTLYHHRR
ncbi:MAG: heavy metal translocating P-type ATPase [Eubacteriales bacterium]|nr:heavy metal translocating P-type ATPase [Eubacteriales bacterium]